VAIVQISRITNRKGLNDELPQLAGAELGWSTDTRQLYIGNGTLAEGAPVVGNTEILTEFSDILAFQTTYTYKGEAAGYIVQTGPSPGAPVTQSLQSWLDQWASVKDFGAVGDGVTDDTAAINRALFQLFCVDVNPQIRRSLFFPAGVYLVNETIVIPSFATLYGEGKDNSVIKMAAGDDSALRAYVARTGDSLQQTGVNIGSNGAITPQYITIRDLGFETADTTYGDIFLVEDADNCSFSNVNFMGPFTTADLDTDTDNMAGVRFASSASLICKSITFDGCTFTGTTYGINTDQQIQGIVVCNSTFDILYKGIVLGDGTPVLGGPTGFRIVNNSFDNIYAEGVVFGDIELNATGHNMFYDVGNHFNGTTSPATSIIVFQASNNISVGDMFERADAYATIFQRIDLNNQASIGFVGGEILKIGPNEIQAEPITTLSNNASNQTIYTFDATLLSSVSMSYSIVRSTGVRNGVFTVIPAGGGSVNYNDDYVENTSVGVTLSATQAGDQVSIKYTTTNTGTSGTITFTISSFRV
jgi:hypothetical protein